MPNDIRTFCRFHFVAKSLSQSRWKYKGMSRSGATGRPDR